MNTSIYSFYSGKLSAGRLSNAYSLKKSTVSNSTVATVTASSSAVAGTQSLKVKKLASSGYLTGGTVKDGKANITGSSKLSDITGSTSQGSVTLSVDGKSTTIELTEDMTVNQFVVKLRMLVYRLALMRITRGSLLVRRRQGKKVILHLWRMIRMV